MRKGSEGSRGLCAICEGFTRGGERRRENGRRFCRKRLERGMKFVSSNAEKRGSMNMLSPSSLEERGGV